VHQRPEEQGQGLAFADQVSSLIWGGTKGWDEGAHLSDACEGFGLDLEAMDAQAENEK
jgi:hypothetical protein